MMYGLYGDYGWGAGNMMGWFGGGIVMIVALLFVHFPQGINPLANGGEAALLNLAAFLVMKAYGAGKWSLEKALWKKEMF